MEKITNYKLIRVLLIWLCLCSQVHIFAQAPVIIPKGQPIVLKLDPSGNYTITHSGDKPLTVNQLATITNSTDSATKLKLKPQSFDCSTTGKQSVNLWALTNGSATTPNPNAILLRDLIAMCFDPAGNLYFAGNDDAHIIRKLTPDGEVSIFVGTGQSGNNNGPGNQATFSRTGENGLVSDAAGNLYFSDLDNSTIRKITPDGVVSNFSGPFDLPTALTIDKQGDLYVAVNSENKIYKITPDGKLHPFAGSGHAGDADGVGKEVEFDYISSLAVDNAGNVYAGQLGTHAGDNDHVKIKKITPDGVVSTFFNPGYISSPNNADEANAFFGGPYSLRFDPAGNLYVGDAGMLKIIRTNGKVETIAGDATTGYADGTGANAHFHIIFAIDIDPCGNLYLADEVNNLIRKVTLGGVVSTILGGGTQSLTGNVGPSTCQGDRMDIPVDVQSTPAFTSAYTDLNLKDCASLADYAIKATTTDNCPDSQVKVTQSPAPNSPIYNNTPVLVTLTATDKTGGTATVSFTVTAKYAADPPGRSVSVSASATKICIGDPVTFTANVTNGEPGNSFQWIVNGLATGPDSPTFSPTDLKDGDLINCAITTANGCGVPNTGLDIQMSVNPLPTVTLKPNEEILSGGTVSLNPTVTGDILTYLWTPATGLSDANSQFPIAKPELTTTYKLKVTSIAGCEAEGSVTVKVVPQIVIPNTFTPNGDGINDLWSIKYLENYVNGIITIYNRNGTVVFQSRGYPKAWNGTDNGAPVPAGAYYYVIDLKDGSAVRTGNVNVVR